MTSKRPPCLPAFRLLPGTGSDWLAVFLSRLSGRLRSGPSGDALLIEQWWDGTTGEVRLLPYSERLLLAMEALGEEIPIRWVRSLPDRACEPPDGLVEEWFRVVEATAPRSPYDPPAPLGAMDPVRGRPSPAIEGPRPVIGPLLQGLLLSGNLRFWVALQTHWSVRSDGEVRTTSRGRLATTHEAAVTALHSALEAHLRRIEGDARGRDLRLRRVRWSRGRQRQWTSGARPWWTGPWPRAVRHDLPLPVPLPMSVDPRDDPRLRHIVVLGASGSGKTAALAHLAREALLNNRPVVLFDVHGDLAPRVIADLPPAAVERVRGVDVTGSPEVLPGLSVFGPVPREDREALVAHLIAALKRLSTENGETFWGFRLERLFETFLRIVQDQGGDLVDLWALLTDPGRREAARLTTDRPEVLRFLEELDGVVRRQPEFLWPAASRVAKVVGSPLLAALLAPRERSMEVGGGGRGADSTIWRLPMGELGPEGVTFAVTLLLTRIYLDQVRRAVRSTPSDQLRVLFVLDEAHLFPSRLLSEIIAEGRKFGIGLVLATQYPTRLAPELREALTGAAGTVYLFRVPWATAVPTGSWAGLSADSAQQVLPSLPPGWAVVSSTGAHADRRLIEMPPGPPTDLPGWFAVARRTADAYGSPVDYGEVAPTPAPDRWEERLLLGLVGLEAEGGTVDRRRLFRWIEHDEPFDPVEVSSALDGLVRRGWMQAQGETLVLSSAGADRIGLSARTGARPESVEHRALLVTALRIFARHHERLEILRQGRFDTRLPDGRVTLLPPIHRRWCPSELARALDARRKDWAWRLFDGRDVHVEAEVSGATRRERIERDWTKARDARAFLLVLVGDAGRARSVRRYLERLGVPRTRGTVWTLRAARTVIPPSA